MDTKPLRILHLTSEYPPVIGGVATHVHQLAAAMASNGHDVQVMSTVPGPQGMDGQVTVHRPKVPRSRLLYTTVLKYQLRRFLAENPVDIIHVHGMRPIEATKGLNIPVVFTNHTSGFLKRIEKGGARRLKNLAWRFEHLPLILAPSQELIDASLATGYQGATEFVSNGVDAELFYPEQQRRQTLRQQWGVSEQQCVVLLARRLASKNGVVDFAHACAKLGSENIRIVIAGDGAEKPAMLAAFNNQQHANAPLFLGAVANTDMPDIYRAADICVLPSHYEATSITGLEAMSSALPLVGTNVGGIPTLVEDQHNGLLVEPRNPEQLGDTLAQLASQPKRVTELGDAARTRVLERFTWRQIARQTVEGYMQHALGGK